MRSKKKKRVLKPLLVLATVSCVIALLSVTLVSVYFFSGFGGERESITIPRLVGRRFEDLGEIDRIEKKLSNEGFVAKAPAAVVDGEKAKLAKYRENLEGVLSALSKLK